VVPVVLWLSFFWVLPLVMALFMSFREFDPQTIIGVKLTLQNYIRLLTDSFYLQAFGRTMWIAAISTLLSILLGYPAAYHVFRLRSQKQRAVLTLVLLVPVMLSLVVTAFAWMLLLGPNGFVNRILMGFHLASEPLRLLNTEIGVIIVLVYSFSPYMVLSINAALENIDPSLTRAARILGATSWQAFWKITLPLSVPGILSGALMVFSLSAAAFVTPYVIGGNRVKVIPLLIYNFAVTLFDWPDAAALCVLLVVLMIIVTFFISRSVERRFMSWMGRS
jgi:putative spermidine/putrescine transport system permease protein